MGGALEKEGEEGDDKEEWFASENNQAIHRRVAPDAATEAQIDRSTEQLRRVEEREQDLTRRFKSAQRCEIYNASTGVAESRFGLPLGKITVRLLKVEGLERRGGKKARQKLRAMVFVRDKNIYPHGRPYEGSVSPPPQWSRVGRVEQKVYSGVKKTFICFNQEFILSPIKSDKAEVVVRFFSEGHEVQKSGQVVQPLIELADQRTRKIAAPIEVNVASGIDASAANVLHLQLQWSFSKTKPLEAELYRTDGKKRELERRIESLYSPRGGVAS